MRPIPSPNVPFINKDTGLIERVWYEFLKGTENISLSEISDYEAPLSLTDSLDSAFGDTRGSLLRRGSSGWEIIEPVADGYVLTDGGVGADPGYEAIPETGAWHKIGIYTPSSAAQLDITGLGSYKALRLSFIDWIPATDSVELNLRLSSDNGSSFISTNYVTPTGGVTDRAQIAGAATIGNASTDGGAKGVVNIFDFGVAQKTTINGSYSFIWFDTSGNYHTVAAGANVHTPQTAMNAIRIYFSSGNIASGTLVLEGL